MIKAFLLTALFFSEVYLFAQYKYDNVLYKTVYLEDLSSALQANPGYLLLDVRSKGEFCDTSDMSVMNLGHLINALNISVTELSSHLDEIKAYKSKPIFVYCSHSRRSRIASKILADSGFTNVFNINGGMTYMLQMPASVAGLYATNNNYSLLSPEQFCKEASDPKAYIIDIRPKPNQDLSAQNESVPGGIKSAHHIPLRKLKHSLRKFPKEKKILLLDDTGEISTEAASLLSSKGFTHIAVLLNGLTNFIHSNSIDTSCKNSMWLGDNPFRFISPDELKVMTESVDSIIMLDIRTHDEFINRSDDSRRNTGHIKNAINIPSAELSTRWKELENVQHLPIVLYSFSNDPWGYNAASLLSFRGFTKVYLLTGGIFDIRWKAANLKGKIDLGNLIEDVPPNNL